MKFKLNYSGLATQRGLHREGLVFLLVHIKAGGHVGRITDKKQYLHTNRYNFKNDCDKNGHTGVIRGRN